MRVGSIGLEIHSADSVLACGIWFSKWKAHRPPEKWEKDEKRLSQVRKKRANGNGASRSKKSRTKSDTQMNLTSEAGLLTDPLGPLDGAMSPNRALADSFFTQQPDVVSEAGSGKDRRRMRGNGKGPGSTHSRASTNSRGSGTPGSPITFNDELGATRRLLFPSPRKDSEQRVLGEVAVNIVQTSPEFGGTAKEGVESSADKENISAAVMAHNHHDNIASDDFADLFGTPPARPSTPPPRSSAHSGGPFKTPTRPTPSHRPITRSVSKSMRSSSRTINSPSQALMPDRTPSRTPSKTPRSAAVAAATGGLLTGSAGRRRSPRNNHNNNIHNSNNHDLVVPHLLLDDLQHQQHLFDSPFTKSLNQLLSEANDFVAAVPPTPSHHHQHQHQHRRGSGGRNGGGGNNSDNNGGVIDEGEFHIDLDDHHFDFGSLLSTDGIMPSSPPAPMMMLRGGGGGGGGGGGPSSAPSTSSSQSQMVHFGGTLSYDEAAANLWAQLGATTTTTTTATATGNDGSSMGHHHQHQNQHQHHHSHNHNHHDGPGHSRRG